MTLLITGLAVYRITRLIVDDTILEPFRIAFAGKSEWRYSLVTCYWCAGFWISVAATLTLYYTSSVALPVAGWWFLPFALSALTGILGDRV